MRSGVLVRDHNGWETWGKGEGGYLRDPRQNCTTAAGEDPPSVRSLSSIIMLRSRSRERWLIFVQECHHHGPRVAHAHMDKWPAWPLKRLFLFQRVM